MANSDDLDLRTLDDSELVEQMHDDLYDGLKDEIADGTRFFWSGAGVLIGCSMMPSSAV
ncbi:MAG: hypothetical protein R2865_00650 [Deinococcales bacterium]